MTNAMNNRPIDLLDEFQQKYGLDRKRALNKASMCYYRSCEWSDTDSAWRANWHIGGAAGNPADSIAETFAQIAGKLREDAQAGRGRDARLFDALVVVLPGDGRYVVRHQDGRDWDDFTEDEKAEFLQDKELDAVKPGMNAPTRLVSIVTLEGLAAEISVFFSDGEPLVERTEQWVDDGKGTIPQPGGPMEEALIQMFTFIQLLRETVGNYGDLTLSNIISTATHIPEERGGAQMSAHLLQMVGMALESGVLTQDSDEGGDCLAD